MADTLVADLEALEKRWLKEQPLEEVLALARSSRRWDVAMAVFEDCPDVMAAIKHDEILFDAQGALGDYLTTLAECGEGPAAIILRSIKRLASICGHVHIWREVFEGHLTPEKLDKTFPLISEEIPLPTI